MLTGDGSRFGSPEAEGNTTNQHMDSKIDLVEYPLEKGPCCVRTVDRTGGFTPWSLPVDEEDVDG